MWVGTNHMRVGTMPHAPQGVGRKKFLIPGCSVIFAGKARDSQPLQNFFPYTFTPNFL